MTRCPRRRTQPSHPIVRRAMLASLALAVALLHVLGLAHRALHAPGHATQGHATQGHAAADTVRVATFAAVDAFGHAPGDVACTAFDHAALGAVDIGVPTPVVDAVAPGGPPVRRASAPQLAPQASGHLARGPPLLG